MKNLLIPSAVLSLLCGGLTAEGVESLDQLFQKAEQPLIDYRANYLKALQKAKDDAQKAGKVEKIPEYDKDIKEFSEGGFPDGVGINAQLEKIFIFRYRPALSLTSKRLRAIAGKAGTEEVNARVKERLEFWKTPIVQVGQSNVLVTYQWTVSMDPAVSALSGDVDGKRRPVRDVFAGNGISFPEGASATHSPESHVLLVTNTWNEIFKMDELMRHFNLIK